MILADTDVLIDYLAGIESVRRQVIGYIESEQLLTSAVTSFELLCGFRPGRRGEALQRLLELLPALPLDSTAAARGAEIHRELGRRGEPIGMADCLIAGIAQTHRLPVLTRNRKHFERITRLELVEVVG